MVSKLTFSPYRSGSSRRWLESEPLVIGTDRDRKTGGGPDESQDTHFHLPELKTSSSKVLRQSGKKFRSGSFRIK
jgi:hypothetical protein